MQTNYSNLKEVIKARIFALDEILNSEHRNPQECPKFLALDPESKQMVLTAFYRIEDEERNEAEGIDVNYE